MPNTPTHLIYHGKGPKGGKKIWTKIGAVWPAKSGHSSTISWDYIPRVNGITVMLPYDKRPDDDVQVVPDEYPA
jgi:hypothetical protein